MLTRLRVRVPDRPGTLGRAAAALGTAGIDIHQIRALERSCGRAILDLVVALPNAMLPGVVARMLSGIPGVRVEGCWQAPDSLDLDTDLEILNEVLSTPRRAVQMLVDAMPRLLHAHWSVALSVPDGSLIHASWRAPRIVPPDLATVRSRAFTAPDGSRVALAPMGPAHALLTGRRNAPPFHQVELHRLAMLGSTVATVLPTAQRREQRRTAVS
jgi:ACT domain-containing protein